MPPYLGRVCDFFCRFATFQSGYHVADKTDKEQLAINDTEKFGFVIEGMAEIAETIPRYAIYERISLLSESSAYTELRRALVRLYAEILVYISTARMYFEEKSISESTTLADCIVN